MTTSILWFLVLVGACVIGPYLLGVRPRTRRDWVVIAVTVGFIAVMLPLMVSLRSP